MADFEEAGDHDVFQQSSQGFRRQERRAVRAGDSPRHGRADGAGGRADQGERLTMAAFSLARRLRAGETVYSGWCALGSPIVAETIAREGFTAVTHRPAARPVGHRRDRRRHRRRCTHAGAAPIVRVPLGDFAIVEPRARFRRRRRHRADDQHRRATRALRRASPNIRRSASAAGGPTRAMTLRRFADQKDYLRDANDRTVTLAMIETRSRAGQRRRDRGNARHRRAVRRAVRSVDHAERRRQCSIRIRKRSKPRSTQIVAAAKKAGKIAGLYCANAERARRRSPSAASASSRSAAISASCAPAPRRSVKTLKG